MSRVECDGTEASLLDCPHTSMEDITRCTHTTDANVICTGESQRYGERERIIFTASYTAPSTADLPNECENGQVRIVDGTVPNEGRVELCFHGHWGTVCSDTWDNTDAGVVCRQIGYGNTGEYGKHLLIVRMIITSLPGLHSTQCNDNTGPLYFSGGMKLWGGSNEC